MPLAPEDGDHLWLPLSLAWCCSFCCGACSPGWCSDRCRNLGGTSYV